MKSRTSMASHQLPPLKSRQHFAFFSFFESAAVASMALLLHSLVCFSSHLRCLLRTSRVAICPAWPAQRDLPQPCRSCTRRSNVGKSFYARLDGKTIFFSSWAGRQLRMRELFVLAAFALLAHGGAANAYSWDASKE